MSIQESRSPSSLSAQRWTRFGNDRLCVKTADGLDAGWLDLIDGSRTISDVHFAEDLTLTIDRWLAAGPLGSGVGTSNPPPPVSAHAEES